MATNLNYARDYYYARALDIAAPAAGSNSLYTTVQRAILEIQQLQFDLTTSVAAANRFVYVAALDPYANPAFQVFAPVPQTASLSWTYLFVKGLGSAYQPTGSTKIMVGLPVDVALGFGSSIAIGVTNIQAADQLGIQSLSFRGWPTAL